MANLSWINPEVFDRKEEYKLTFQEKKILTIENFLKEEKAEELYQWFTHDMPENWWHTAFFGPEDLGFGDAYSATAKTFARDTEEHIARNDGEYLNECHKVAHERFSYVFDRNMGDHILNCACSTCSTLAWINNDCAELMLELTGYSDEGFTLGSTFVNRYRAKHFLSPHTDRPNGKLGQIYSLVKDWKTNYGGNLFCINNNDEIIEVVKPVFNRMSIFDTDDLPVHFVEHLTPYCPITRISITGWYAKAKSVPD